MKLFFIFLLVSITLYSCKSNKRNLPEIHECCQVKSQCFGATSKEYLKQLNRVCSKQDTKELYRMIDNKTVYVIKPFYDCKVLEISFPEYKIRVKIDSDKEVEVWIPFEFIKEKSY